MVVSVEAELDLLAGRVVVGGDGLQPVAADLALDGRRALLARAGGARLALGLGVLGAATTHLGFHLRYLHRQLAVQRVPSRFYRHVAEANTDLRIL